MCFELTKWHKVLVVTLRGKNLCIKPLEALRIKSTETGIQDFNKPKVYCLELHNSTEYNTHHGSMNYYNDYYTAKLTNVGIQCTKNDKAYINVNVNQNKTCTVML